MQSPRCGVPDLDAPHEEEGPTGGLTSLVKTGKLGNDVPRLLSSERPKRFILGGGGWSKRSITYQ